MAEFVQQSIEEMLPELEQMERVGLFSAAETKTILRKRRNYEYKLRRRTKQKADYLNYAQYEINLLSLIRKRRERLGYNFKREEIDVAIVQRVHKLFNLALFRFQDDVKLWLSHVEFSKMRRERATVSRLYTRMLQIHNKKPKVWIMAAKWEMEECKAVDNARSLLQRALRFNPDSRQLWIEYFRMELMSAEKMRKRREVLGVADMEDDEETSDVVFSGQVALVVYKQAMEAFNDDAELCVSFLEVAALFDFAEDICDKILTDLQDHHGDKDVAWDGIARHQLIGRNIDQQERIAAICKVYDKAVLKIPSKPMWSYYLSFCVAQCQRKLKKKALAKCFDLTLSVFERASNAKCLSETMFQEWMRVLIKSENLEKLQDIVVLATTEYPQSPALWKERLALSFRTDSEGDIIALLHTVLSSIPDKEAWPLWEMAFDWCREKQQNKMEEFLEMGLNKGAAVSTQSKCVYIQWAWESGDLHKVRRLYKRLCSHQPLSVEFFLRYIHIETEQEDVKMKRVRKAYEDAIREFGSSDKDLWLSYIQSEMTLGKGQPENVGTLHWRAVKTLDGAFTQDFLDKYTLLQNGHLDNDMDQ